MPSRAKISRRAFLTAAGASSIGNTFLGTTEAKAATPAKPTFRILSLDGGGVRGYLSAKILANIEQYADRLTKTTVSIGQRFDFITGTSTGGIIGLGLASGRSAREIVQFYEALAPKVFAVSEQRSLSARLHSPKYESRVIRSHLETLFGKATIEDVKTDICITSVALSTAQPRFYKSDYLQENGRLDEKLSDVALATSAAPTYFASHDKSKYSGHLVDGGVCANNPSMVGIIDALRFERSSKRGAPAPQSERDILLVSIGTGEQPTMPYSTPDLGAGGLMQWGLNISEVMFESQSWLAHYQSFVLLGERYLRISPSLKFSMAMDDVSKINLLRDIADIGGRETSFIKSYLL